MSKIPKSLLNSLIAHVEVRLEIRNVTRIDIMEIWNNVDCRCLHIDDQNLDSAETCMLLDLMYLQIEILEIGVWNFGDIIVSLSDLIRYV